MLAPTAVADGVSTGPPEEGVFKIFHFGYRQKCLPFFRLALPACAGRLVDAVEDRGPPMLDLCRFRPSLPSLSALFASLALVLFQALLPPPSAASPRRFEEALPGFKVARVLWREGKLVLEHDGKLVVLRAGDSLPGLPLVAVKTIDERGVVLQDASSTPPGVPVVVPDRWIRLERAAEGDGFTVLLLSATAPPAPAPQVEAPMVPQPVAPDGTDGKALLGSESGQQAPLVPATQQGGGGGR